MHSDVLICVQTYNRKETITQTFRRLREICDTSGAKLLITNDNSTEYDLEFLEQYADILIPLKSETENGCVRLTEGRTKHLSYFEQSDFQYCYFCDSDMYHHKDFITEVKRLSDKFKKPSGIYRGRPILEFHIGEQRYTMAEGKSLFFSKSIEFYNHMLRQFKTDKQLTTKNWEGVLYKSWKKVGGHHVISDISFAEHFHGGGVNTKNYYNRTGEYPVAMDLHPDLVKEIKENPNLQIL